MFLNSNSLTRSYTPKSIRLIYPSIQSCPPAGTERPTPAAAAVDLRSHSLSPDSGGTDSLSNPMSSSLREDSQSVSSLDLPASKVSSLDNGGTDSQSVSSMEFGAVEGGGGRPDGGGVSESKSLDSLDLRAAGEGEEDGEDGGREWVFCVCLLVGLCVALVWVGGGCVLVGLVWFG